MIDIQNRDFTSSQMTNILSAIKEHMDVFDYLLEVMYDQKPFIKWDNSNTEKAKTKIYPGR